MTDTTLATLSLILMTALGESALIWWGWKSLHERSMCVWLNFFRERKSPFSGCFFWLTLFLRLYGVPAPIIIFYCFYINNFSYTLTLNPHFLGLCCVMLSFSVFSGACAYTLVVLPLILIYRTSDISPFPPPFALSLGVGRVLGGVVARARKYSSI